MTSIIALLLIDRKFQSGIVAYRVDRKDPNGSHLSNRGFEIFQYKNYNIQINYERNAKKDDGEH